MLSHLLVDHIFIQKSMEIVQVMIERGDCTIISLLTAAISQPNTAEVIAFCQDFLFFQILNYLVDASVNEKIDEKTVISFQEFTIALFKGHYPKTLDMAIVNPIFTQSSIFQPFSVSAPPHQTIFTSIYTTLLQYGATDATFNQSISDLGGEKLLQLAST